MTLYFWLRLINRMQLASLIFCRNINFAKSILTFSKRTPQCIKEDVIDSLRIRLADDLGWYLGTPLSSKKLKAKDFTFLLAKVSDRLNSWTNRFLTQVGRCVLIRSTLAALPSHLMQTCLLPKSVLNKLDSIHRNFL